MTKAINLPQEFFHCPELSKHEKQYLIQKAQDSAKALVESARSSHGPVRWSEAGVHKGVQMYKGEARNPTSAAEPIHYVCGATSIQATIEEVAAFMDVSTTPKFKAYVPHQHELLDGVVLYTLVPPSPENQYLHQVTIKWCAAHISSKLIKNRDFLTLECQDVFTDATGRRGWVRSYHSIKLPCCPDFQDELGFVRGSFYHTGYVFVESERRGWLDCIHTLQVNLKGNLRLPSSVHFIAMRRRIGSVGELGRALQQRRLGKHTFLSDLELVPKSQRTRCHVCAAKFGMITRKSRCRKCGEVVCGQCTQTWEVSLPKSGVKKVRVCATCACSSDLGTVPASQTVDEISLMSSVSHDSDRETPSFNYNDHQAPLRLKGTILEEPQSSGSDDPYRPSLMPPPPPGPQLASQAMLNRPQSLPSHHPSSHNGHYGPRSEPRSEPNRRDPMPYDHDPLRPIGFVHQSEYDRPRYENPRHGPYSEPYRDSYRADYDRGYGMPPPPSHGPRHPSEYRRYPDEYGYYPPPHHGPPPQRYDAHGRKPYPESSNGSLTAHALERHTREAGRPGPVAPHAYEYEYDRPMLPPPPQHHPASYHAPPHPHDYPPQQQLAPYRDSAYERDPSMHAALFDHQYPQRPSGSFIDDGANLRSSMYSSHGRPSDLDAEAYRQAPPPQQPPSQQPPPQYPHVQRQSFVHPPALPIQEQVVPENELVKTNPRPAAVTVAPELERTSSSRSSSPDQEMAVNAARLMQQQQNIQDQLHKRALSFTSDPRYSLHADDEDDDDDEHGLEDWSTTSPATRAMLNEFKSLELNNELPKSYPQRQPSAEPEPETRTASPLRSTMLADGEVKTLSVVQLYQKILELTKKQHVLESDANALTTEKDAIAHDLKALYERLNEVTNEHEVAF